MECSIYIAFYTQKRKLSEQLRASLDCNDGNVRKILKSIVNLAYFLACGTFCAPRKMPVNAEAAYEIPKGSIKMNETMFTITTSAASASTDIRPEKIASSSKTHHSKQSIQAPGMAVCR